MGLAATSKAIEHITDALLNQKEEKIKLGRDKLKGFLKEINVDFDKTSRNKLMVFNNCKEKRDLYLGIYDGSIPLSRVRQCFSPFAIFFRIKVFLKPVILF